MGELLARGVHVSVPVDATFILDVILRWLHIFAAIAAVGGLIFMRLALLPAVSQLPGDQQPVLHAAIRVRWSKVVAGAILFLLVSGLWNYFLIIERYNVVRYYHPLAGVKILLSLAIFFLASMLVGRTSAAARFQAQRKRWLNVTLTLAVLVVGISGVLRTAPKEPKTPEQVEEAAVGMGERSALGRAALGK
jgi:uncharacterized membrane protein